MKLSIEMEAEDWLDLCKLHMDVMEIITKNMAEDPLAYSSAARMTKEIFEQVCRKLPNDEFERIRERREKDLSK